LETIVAEDLRRLHESGNPADRAMLMFVGFDESPSVRSYRGRTKKWDITELRRLREDVDVSGIQATAERLGLSVHRVRELLRKAKKAEERGTRSPVEAADAHRAFRLGLERKRDELDANWKRQQAKVEDDPAT
jgi:hypothetical protein